MFSASTGASTAYPRWRGEHSSIVRSSRSTEGPTPAGAGSTRICSLSRTVSGAYPRWRGEHGEICLLVGLGLGLPPLARGARSGSVPDGGGPRPTPAGAGSTVLIDVDHGHVRAYPRWRGEHDRWDERPQSTFGLPPLARGARHISTVSPVLRGPTPAGAGSTAS